MRFLTLVCALGFTAATSGQDESGDFRQEIYDVRDLLESKTALDGNVLVDLVEQAIGWRVPAPANGIMNIRAGEKDQSSIRKTLNRVRESGEPIVWLTVRTFKSKLDIRPAKSESLVNRLKAEEAGQLDDRVGKEPGRTAPTSRLSLFERQAGTVLDGEEISYVSRWNVRIGADGKADPEPVVSTARVGTSMTVVPSVKDRGLRLESIRIELAEARSKPPASRKIKSPHGDIEDPEIQTVEYELSSLVAEGEMLLVGPLESPWGLDEKKPHVWLLLRGGIVRSGK